MSDSFNPHEILSRLRSKPGLNNSNGPALSNTSASGSGNGNPPSSSNTKASNSKTIKTPQSLTLTATQRQDNLAVRNELEKEIKRLQDEIVGLKGENKQLKADKEDTEKQLMDLKAKTDETVTKLRGKIAALTNHRGGAEGTGKLYPPPPPSLLNGNNNKSLVPNIPKSPGQSIVNKGLATSGKASTNINFSAIGNPESFREPTFSELMRRGTNEHPDFQESLRKVPLPSAPTVSSNLNHNNSMNINTFPFENSKGTGYKNVPIANNNSFFPNESFLSGQDMKSPGGHYGYQSQLVGNSNNRNAPLNFHMDHHPNNTFPADNFPPSSSTPNANTPNTPGFNAHHNVFNSSKHHPNLFYNNSNTHPSADIMMLPGRDDNAVLIPNNRKGSMLPASASVPFDGNASNNTTNNNADSIPIVEIDLS